MNNVTLTGRLVRDINFTAADGDRKARAFFTVASKRPGKDAGSDFISMTAFGRQAELANEHIGKGHLVAIEGHLHSSSFERGEDTEYRQELIADRIDFLARPAGNSQD